MTCDTIGYIIHTMAVQNKGAMLLHRTNSHLYTSRPVQLAAERRAIPLDKPDERINAWLEDLQHIYINRVTNPEVRERIFTYYYNTYVIKPEDIPQSYWNTQAQIMIDEGRSAELRELGIVPVTKTEEQGNHSIDYVFPPRVAEPQIAEIIERQRISLKVWLEYLCSPESEIYPMWAKWWAFNGVIQLSATFNEEKQRFNKRNKHTIASFLPFNAEALARSIDQVRKAAQTVKIGEGTSETNFRKIYSNEISTSLIHKPTDEVLRNTQGHWVTYAQGSDPTILAKALENRGTGWCTATIGTANSHLACGDFHVYFSQDALGIDSIPRVALRMDRHLIAEVRGIGPFQELDPYIGDVVEEKLRGFIGGDTYLTRVANMKRLSQIVKKKSKGDAFTPDDLRFLYELDRPIEGLGIKDRDERISMMLIGRNKKEDLVRVLGCPLYQISFTSTEATRADVLHHVGNLTAPDPHTKLPPHIYGDLFLDLGPNSQLILEVPYTTGTAYLKGGISVMEILAPHVGGLHMRSVNYIKKIIIEGDSIPGDIIIDQLIGSDVIKLPNHVGGNVRLRIGQTNQLVLPKYVSKDLSLYGFPPHMLELLPDHIGGDLLLEVKTVDGLRFNSFVGKGVLLYQLEEAHDLVFVSDGFSRLAMGNLRTASNVILPKHVRGNVGLESLRSLKGVILPQKVDGNLFLYGLTSIEDAVLPHTVGETVSLGSMLPYKDVLELRRLNPSLRISTPHESLYYSETTFN